MAISFVNFNTASGSATNLVLTRPTGTAVGDLLIATVELYDNSKAASVAGTGWTVLDAVTNAATSNNHCLVTLWRLDNGSGTYTLTWDGTSLFRSGQILAYRGASGVDVHSLTAQTSNASTTLRGTSVTTTVANATLVMIGCTANAESNVTPPSGMTERVDAVTQYSADVIQTAAGSTGNKDATLSSADASIGGIIALIPYVRVQQRHAAQRQVVPTRGAYS